jgi:uncharacterized membrane protein YkoI
MMNRGAMMWKLAIAFTCTAAIVGAPLTLAGSRSAEPEIKAEKLSSARLRAAAGARLSVVHAISAAEKHSNGGKVLEAAYQPARSGSKAAYTLRTYQNNAIWEGRIDADSGQMSGPGKTIPESILDEEDKAELSGLQAASTTIAQAVRTAERHAKGKAISAGIEETKSGIVWEVVVLANGKARKVVVDPASGQPKSS